jgi:hypothetical protein
MANGGRTVTVCRQGITALEEPRFLIEKDGKLYLTVAVLQYDPKHPGITRDQSAAIRGLQDQLDKGTKAHAVHFAAGQLSDEIIGANMVGPGPIGLHGR